jgi:hypothetical protein
MLKELANLYVVDLTCDPALQSFYEARNDARDGDEHSEPLQLAPTPYGRIRRVGALAGPEALSRAADDLTPHGKAQTDG